MKKQLIAGAAGVALISGLGLGIAQAAQADSDVPSTSDSTTAASEAPGQGHRGMGIDAAALATKLGLSESALADALAAVHDSEEPADRPSADATEAERTAARDARDAALATALATELNIDETTVANALTELQEERLATRAADSKATLDQAVTDGTLTQSEADTVQKAIDAGIVVTRDGEPGRN
jgi:predicted flavoprotein YhiN